MKRILIAAMLSAMLLTACGGKLVRTEYIRQTIPPLPAKPEYYPVPFDGNYCLDEQGARNLLKNRELDKDYQTQLEGIIEGLR
jgi:hypothetical protein